MNYRTLGKNGPVISAFGLGCMGMSGSYGAADRTESIYTIHAALDAGINLIDTGDFYGAGHNEMLVGEALKGVKREKTFVAVKFGEMCSPSGRLYGMDGRPALVRSSLAYTLKRLGLDYIDLYQPARVDPNVPIEETVGAIADMVKAGYVRYIGLSEAGVGNIRRANDVHTISWLQTEYSLLSRDIEAEVLPTVRELGIGVTAYGVLSRGLLGGELTKEGLVRPGDVRRHMPRFAGGNLEKNLALTEALRVIADGKQATVAQIAFAWVAAQGNDIIPLIGTKTQAHLFDALKAQEITLNNEDLALIEGAVPKNAVVGERYPQQLMKSVGR